MALVVQANGYGWRSIHDSISATTKPDRASSTSETPDDGYRLEGSCAGTKLTP